MPSHQVKPSNSHHIRRLWQHACPFRDSALPISRVQIIQTRPLGTWPRLRKVGLSHRVSESRFASLAKVGLRDLVSKSHTPAVRHHTLINRTSGAPLEFCTRIGRQNSIGTLKILITKLYANPF